MNNLNIIANYLIDNPGARYSDITRHYALRKAGFGPVASTAATSLRLSGKKIPSTLIVCGGGYPKAAGLLRWTG